MKNLKTPGKTRRVCGYAFYSCTDPQVAKVMDAGEIRGLMKFGRLITGSDLSSENSLPLYLENELLTVLFNTNEVFSKLSQNFLM